MELKQPAWTERPQRPSGFVVICVVVVVVCGWVGEGDGDGGEEEIGRAAVWWIIWSAAPKEIIVAVTEAEEDDEGRDEDEEEGRVVGGGRGVEIEIGLDVDFVMLVVEIRGGGVGDFIVDEGVRIDDDSVAEVDGRTLEDDREFEVEVDG